jgi:hypothetical protein
MARPKSRQGRYERIALDVREDLLFWLDSLFGNRREMIEEALIALKAKKESEKMTTALEKFLASDDFQSGVIASTKASWGGSGYSVELFPDESYRILWNNQIGNRYETSGQILALPTLDTEGMSEYVDSGAGDEDEFLSEAFYAEEDTLKAEMREKFSRR